MVPFDQPRQKTFPDFPWLYSYKTSAVGPEGLPADILHDFYIPALKLSARYDRVAGFFRSSSLAVASQGFSAFTSAAGVMRMVVGADLDPQDVEAIIEGDRERLARVETGSRTGTPVARRRQKRHGIAGLDGDQRRFRSPGRFSCA